MRAGLAAILLLFSVSVARADLRVFEANVPPSEDDTGVPRLTDPSGPPVELPPPAPSEAPEPDASAATEGESPAETGTETVTPPSAPPPTTEPATAEAEEPPPPAARPLLDDHRWLDLTAFVQPGFIVRLDDPGEPVSAGVTDDTFWLQRARFGLRAQLFTWLRMRVELETTPTPLLQDAYLDVVPHPFFGVRIGQFIVPFLQTYRFNELNASFLDRAIYVPNRPDRDFIRDLSPRDVGFSLSGRIGDLAPEAHTPVFGYDLALMIGRGPNIALNDDDAFLWAGRLQLFALGVPEGVERQNDLARNDFPRPVVGFGAYSNCDDRENWNRGFTVDVEARWEGLFFEGAFVWLRRGGRDGTVLGNTDGCRGTPAPSGTGTYEYVSHGGHLQLQYVIPRLFTGAGLGALDAQEFELLFRADYVDGNSPYGSGAFFGDPSSSDYAPPANFTDSDNPPSRWRMTFGLNYYPTGQTQLRLGINYQLNREYEDVITGMGTVRGVSNDVLWFQITAGI